MTALMPSTTTNLLTSDTYKLLMNGVGDRPAAADEEQEVFGQKNPHESSARLSNFPPFNGHGVTNVGAEHSHKHNHNADSPPPPSPSSPSSKSGASAPGAKQTSLSPSHQKTALQNNKKDVDFYNSLLSASVNANGPCASGSAMDSSRAVLDHHRLHSTHSTHGGTPGSASASAFQQPHPSSLNSSLGAMLSANGLGRGGGYPGAAAVAAAAHAHLHDPAGAAAFAHGHSNGHSSHHHNHPDLSISAAAVAGLFPYAAGIGGGTAMTGNDPHLRQQLQENTLLNQHQQQLNESHNRLMLGAHQLARNNEIQQEEQRSLERLMMKQAQQQQQQQQQMQQEQRMLHSSSSSSENMHSHSEINGMSVNANVNGRNVEKKRQIGDVIVNNESLSSPAENEANKRLRTSLEQHQQHSHSSQSLENKALVSGSTSTLSSVLSNDLHSSSLLAAAAAGAPTSLSLYGGHGHGHLDQHQMAVLEQVHRQRLLSHHRRMMIDAEMEQLLLRQNNIHNHSISALQLEQSRAALLNSSLSSPFLNTYSQTLSSQQQTNVLLLQEEAMKKREDLIKLSLTGLNTTSSNEDTLEIAVPKKHFSVRPYMHLGTETDEIWLSRFLSFLRLECIEVFTATRTDVFERKTSKKIHINQVGLRCRFCAHMPYRARIVRSSCFPSSICRIYQSLTMMIREHFSRCQEMPAKTREKYTELKWMTKKGEIESKTHWIDSAKSMGMVDTDKGIFLNKPMKLTFPKESSDETEESKTPPPV